MWGIVASAAVLLPSMFEYSGYSQVLVPKTGIHISSDGRFHTCGIVTEDGVTEYINVYLIRCGDPTLASDT
jgi:hypothetical protein